MTSATETRVGEVAGRPQPLHGLLLTFPVAFSVGAVLSDAMYLNSAQIQWSTFSAWLIAFTVTFGALALLRGLFDLQVARRDGRWRRVGLYTLILIGTCLAALVNSFQHAKDGWISVGPLGMTLSIMTAVFALIAGWMLYSGWTVRGATE